MRIEKILGKEELKDIKVKIVPSTLHIDSKLQVQIDEEWQEFVKNLVEKGIKVWNGKKYRFEGIKENVFEISETDYKTLMMLRNLDQLELRNNVTVSTIIITSDNYILFAKRKNVGVFPGVVAWIAGGLEPIDTSDDLLFDNMKVELNEELGLENSEYDIFLEGMYSYKEIGQYSFHFIVNLKLTKEDMVERFEHADEEDENSELIFFENNKKGVDKILNHKNMLDQVKDYFSKYYEPKH